jgi:hypothetical protein
LAEVSSIFPKIVDKYGEGSDLSARVLRAFLYVVAVVRNELFLFIATLTQLTYLEYSTSSRNAMFSSVDACMNGSIMTVYQ